MQRGRDSNPRYTFGVYTLSRRAPSTTRPPLYFGLKGWPNNKKNISYRNNINYFIPFLHVKEFQKLS